MQARNLCTIISHNGVTMATLMFWKTHMNISNIIILNIHTWQSQKWLSSYCITHYLLIFIFFYFFCKLIKDFWVTSQRWLWLYHSSQQLRESVVLLIQVTILYNRRPVTSIKIHGLPSESFKATSKLHSNPSTALLGYRMKG